MSTKSPPKSRRLSIFSPKKPAEKPKPGIDHDDIAKSSANRIISIFQHFSELDYIGEPVSILQHSWQAYELAIDADEKYYAAIACLLHDIGHLLGLESGKEPGMKGCGTPSHESVGSKFLQQLHFSDNVSYLVSQHVNAKRYLVAKNPNYELSEASKITLEFQGGPMSEEEIKDSESNPLWETVIRMRKYDEQAKIADKKPPVDVIEQIYLLCYHEVLSSLKENDKQVYSMSPYPLSTEQQSFYEDNGYLIVKKSTLMADIDLEVSAEDVLKLPDSQFFDWLVHDEIVSDGPFPCCSRIQRCRVENFSKFHNVILTSRNSVDHFFRITEEMRFKVPDQTKYFCQSEAVAYYLQKYVVYRKRKIYVGNNNFKDLEATFIKFNKEKFLAPTSGSLNPDIIKTLDSFEISWVRAQLYKTVVSDLSDLRDVYYDLLVFFSPLGIESLFKNFPDFEQNKTLIAVYGNTTEEAAKAKNLRVDIKAPTEVSPSMAMAIDKYIKG